MYRSQEVDTSVTLTLWHYLRYGKQYLNITNNLNNNLKNSSRRGAQNILSLHGWMFRVKKGVWFLNLSFLYIPGPFPDPRVMGCREKRRPLTTTQVLRGLVDSSWFFFNNQIVNFSTSLDVNTDMVAEILWSLHEVFHRSSWMILSGSFEGETFVFLLFTGRWTWGTWGKCWISHFQ